MRLTRDQRRALFDLCRKAGALDLARAIDRQAATNPNTPVVVKGLSAEDRAALARPRPRS